MFLAFSRDKVHLGLSCAEQISRTTLRIQTRHRDLHFKLSLVTFEDGLDDICAVSPIPTGNRGIIISAISRDEFCPGFPCAEQISLTA